MKITSINKSILGGIVFLAIALCVLMASVLMTNIRFANASAPIGLNAQVATSSTLAVGASNNMYAFGTTTRESAYMCAARIISTTGQPIMISFASLSSTTLSQVIGHQQAASTTVAYDGGIYGCGYMTIRGLNASTTITLTETH